VVDELVRHIREFRPHVILSFGPEGGVTGHTDHSMASIFATLAYGWAGRNNRYPDQLSDGVQPHRAQKLYYATATLTMPGRQPVAPSPVSATIHIGDYLKTKIAAFEAHTTQAPVFPMVRDHILARGPEEVFHLAACSKPATASAEDDLFQGVNLED